MKSIENLKKGQLIGSSCVRIDPSGNGMRGISGEHNFTACSFDKLLRLGASPVMFACYFKAFVVLFALSPK